MGSSVSPAYAEHLRNQVIKQLTSPNANAEDIKFIVPPSIIINDDMNCIPATRTVRTSVRRASLLVRNLPPSINGLSIVMDLFADDDDVLSADILPDPNGGKNPMAIVTFAHFAVAEAALEAHIGRVFRGHKLRITRISTEAPVTGAERFRQQNEAEKQFVQRPNAIDVETDRSEKMTSRFPLGHVPQFEPRQQHDVCGAHDDTQTHNQASLSLASKRAVNAPERSSRAPLKEDDMRLNTNHDDEEDDETACQTQNNAPTQRSAPKELKSRHTRELEKNDGLQSRHFRKKHRKKFIDIAPPEKQREKKLFTATKLKNVRSKSSGPHQRISLKPLAQQCDSSSSRPVKFTVSGVGTALSQMRRSNVSHRSLNVSHNFNQNIKQKRFVSKPVQFTISGIDDALRHRKRSRRIVGGRINI